MKPLSPGFPYEVASECTSETAESTLSNNNKNAFSYSTEVSDSFANLKPQQYMKLVKSPLGIHELEKAFRSYVPGL